MKWEQSDLAHSSEIVVGAVPLSNSAKPVALAVLKTIDPKLFDADVQEGILLLTKLNLSLDLYS